MTCAPLAGGRERCPCKITKGRPSRQGVFTATWERWFRLGRSGHLLCKPQTDAPNFKLRDDEVTVVGTCTCRAYTPAPNNLKSSTDAYMRTLKCWILLISSNDSSSSSSSSNDKKMLVWMSGASRKRAHDLKSGSNRYKLPTASKTTRGTRLASRALISPSSTIGEAQKSFPKLTSCFAS